LGRSFDARAACGAEVTDSTIRRGFEMNGEVVLDSVILIDHFNPVQQATA
jgi:hypothetical protein